MRNCVIYNIKSIVIFARITTILKYKYRRYKSLQFFIKMYNDIRIFIILELDFFKYVTFFIWIFCLCDTKIFMRLFDVHKRVIHVGYSNRYSNNACAAKKRAICSCVKFLSRRRFRDATGSRMRSRNVARIIVRVGHYQIIINRQSIRYITFVG